MPTLNTSVGILGIILIFGIIFVGMVLEHVP